MENLRLSNVGRYSVCKLNVSENLVKMIPKIYGLIERKKKAMKDLIVTESNGGLWVWLLQWPSIQKNQHGGDYAVTCGNY